MTPLLDRYRGAMLGTLAGDALGAPYEWKSPQEILADMKTRGGLKPCDFEPFDYVDPWKKKRLMQKGQPTDDSELAAALAMSICEHRALVESDVYAKLRSFIHDRKSVLTDLAYGTGSTLRASLEPATYEESVAKFEAEALPTPPSNGSLMRCIAIPLVHRGTLPELVDMAMRQSRVTHRNPESQAACAIFSVFTHTVLGGMRPDTAWEKTTRLMSGMGEPINSLLALKLTKPHYEKEMQGKEGWVVLSLRVAVWATLTAKDFADGILRSISVGGDTDTYAAIAGGILGAQYGVEGIPKQWTDVLRGKEVMLTLADKLYGIANPPTR